MLWEYLRDKQLGFRFRRQHPIEGYIADFVCLPLHLVIEVGGEYHFRNGQILKDEGRTRFLNQAGFQVIRFTNQEIITDILSVVQSIQKTMNEMIKNMSNDTNLHSTSPQGTPLLGRGRGRLLIFSAPSGSGKSTIVQWLMTAHPELQLAFSISCTSRPPRGTERDGVEYFFLSPDEFRRKIEADEFLEYEEVYENRFYGTLKAQVDAQTERGENVVFDVDVKGGCNIKNFYGNRALSIFIQAPGIEELRKRLTARATDSPEAIEQRLAKAAYEMTFAPKFDHIVVNDDLAKAEEETYQLVKEFLND